ncbi:MogA/MoaB family molybdenum cofactor biosynthesis protein [Maridesulfovibrio sp.]|uniref:MogA/MoaB family molybdenum cofactor biosynthesis protein n=1 Tax=Maridesulfovibrio sp. TaxID=2795000 RepID=UPI002A18BEE4|nr:MogA/MoaB family molybdenum cofactor biosynthesis protein [Maridesulfovibrio sp.]
MIRCDFSVVEDMKIGDRIVLGNAAALPPGTPCVPVEGDLRDLRAGFGLMQGENSLLRIISAFWADGIPGSRLLTAQITGLLPSGPTDLSIEKTGYSLAFITLSDKGAAGLRMDEAGPLIGEMVKKALPVSIVQGYLIPDERDELKALIMHLAHVCRFDLILTTGGTGVGPRDVSPEATVAVIEKRLPGFERAVTAAGLEKTPHAMISRAVAGTLGESLVINFPGSPKAVRESLEAVIPALKHTVDKLQGDKSDCAS